MNKLDFFKSLLTNKKGISFFYFTACIGLIDIYFCHITKIGYPRHFLLIATLFSISIIIFHWTKTSPKYIDKIIYTFYIIVCVESLLSFLFSDSLFNDHNRKYVPVYYSENTNQYGSRRNGETYSLRKSEFKYYRKPNSLGYPDKEWNIPKDKNTIRIICLGDSFTEGDGAHADSTYVKFLYRSLQRKAYNIEMFNAGNCGSDPFFNFKGLQDKIAAYQPDIILQSFTPNDFYQDFMVRGGNERFNSDGTVSYNKAPWWEKLFASSYILRISIFIFGGYNNFLIEKSRRQAIEKDMRLKSIQLFQIYQEYTLKKNIDLIVFSIPCKSDFELDKPINIFHQKFDASFRKFNLKYYNILPCYNNYLEKSNTSYEEYYWKKDGHHNAKGYEMMAKCLEEIVIPVIEKRVANTNTLVN